MVVLILSFVLLLLGVYGIVVSQNIIKSIILYNVIQSSLIITFLIFTTQDATKIPILVNMKLNQHLDMADPLPQALMMTTIVIGAAITALALMISIKIFHYYGTLNWKELIEREG